MRLLGHIILLSIIAPLTACGVFEDKRTGEESNFSITSSPAPTPSPSAAPTNTALPTPGPLIVYNVNVMSSGSVAGYYAIKRGIPSKHICGLSLPRGLYASWEDFLGARLQLLNCACRLMQRDCATVTPEEIAESDIITNIVSVYGVPLRLTGTPFDLDDEDPPFDYFLSQALFSSADTIDNPTLEKRLETTPADFRSSIVKAVPWGRIDGTTAQRAREMIDRTIEAERTGPVGKVIGTNLPPVSEEFLTKAHESNPAQCDVLSGRWNTDCLYANIKDNEGVPPSSTFTDTTNIGLFLGKSLPESHQVGFGSNWSKMMDWRKSATPCVELCRDLPASEREQCRSSSTDVFKEINTSCVGVAPGFIGWQYRSYPVQYMGFFPAGWTTVNDGDKEKTPPTVMSDSAAYRDAKYTDKKYARFGTRASVPGICFDRNRRSTACVNRIPVHIEMTIPFDSSIVAETESATSFTVRVSYRHAVQTNARFFVWLEGLDEEKKALNSVNHAVSLQGQAHQWRRVTQQKNLTIRDDGREVVAVKLVIYSHMEEVLRDYLDIDAIELVHDASGTQMIDTDRGSFNLPMVGNLAGGDWAANMLERLGGVAFWGSSSHFRTNGHAFTVESNFLRRFYAGKPLGESLMYSGELDSGIIFGDPLYSPFGVTFTNMPTAGLAVADDDTSRNSLRPEIKAYVGQPQRTTWELSKCPANYRTGCTGPWVSVESGVGTRAHTLTTTLGQILDGSSNLFLIRLTARNTVTGTAVHAHSKVYRAIPPEVLYDLNGDNCIGLFEFSAVNSNMGKPGMSRMQGDIDEDGDVDNWDFLLVDRHWFKGCRR